MPPGQRFCNACGHDRQQNKSVPVDEGERRHATVMFSDLSGYTAFNEIADPEVVEALMGEVKAAATEVIERHGGTVNQFVGDEVMALFGVPLAHRDDPRRAVAAALDLHRVVQEIADAKAPDANLSMHTGINSGLVVARRSDGRAGDYVLTGDAVNTAARLRGLALPGELLVSAEAWQQVSDYFEGEACPPVAVKGKERPLASFRVLAKKEAPSPRGGPLFGRVDELQEFGAVALACATRKRSRVMVVRGDPGVGKSRLVAEFLKEARALGFVCHSAAVLDFGAQIGRDAIRSLARSLLGVASTADEAARRQAVEWVSEADHLEADQQLFMYDLADVEPPIGLRALAAAMSTAAREKGSLHALCHLAQSASEKGPLLLMVEDIHWADPWTLERLAGLAMLATRAPLLLVMTTRFAGDPTAGAWRTALHGAPLLGIDLGPLTAEDAMRLALAASSVPGALVQGCVDRAEGNPLFLLQLLLNAGEAAQSSVPGSIQALVHTRMDRLLPADKFALQAAAVLGQRYSLDALRHLVENPLYDCRVMVEQFLVHPDGPEFMFSHALIRDGAYASLLHAKRRRLHVRAAEWFGATDAVLSAEHLELGEHPGAAAAFLEASRSASKQYRQQWALALAERGLALAADRETRFQLRIARAQLLVELGRSAEAVEACREALDDAAQPRERVEALLGMAAGMRLNDRIADGLAALAEAQPLADASGVALQRSRLHHLRGNLLFPLGRHAECLEEHERARLLAHEAGLFEAEVAAVGGLGDAFYLQGRMRSANEKFRECVQLARQHDFGRLEVANLPMVGWSSQHLNVFRGAVETGMEAIALAERAAQPRAELLSRMLVAWVEGVMCDNSEPAERQIELAMRLIRMLGAGRFEAQSLGVRALLSLRRGNRQHAHDTVSQALQVGRASAAWAHIAPTILGISALVETDPEKRRQLLVEGEEILASGSPSHNHIGLRDFAIEVFLEVGDWAAVELNVARLCGYTAQEPLPFCEFLMARAAALVRYGRGERSPELKDKLVELRHIALDAELNAARGGIDSALGGFRVA